MRLRSGLLIGIFGLIVVLLGGWFFTLATALLTYLALVEFFRMAEFKGIRPATKTTLFSSFIIIVSTYLETIGVLEGRNFKFNFANLFSWDMHLVTFATKTWDNFRYCSIYFWIILFRFFT